MKKVSVQLCALLRSVLFIGFSIRILLGLTWLCINFIEVQRFAAPQGVLYPLLLKAFGGVPQLLYLLQLVAACVAGYVLLKPLSPGGLFWRIWFVLAFLTFPMALQCHLALLPHSFVSSLLFLELAFCLRVYQSEEGKVPLKELAKAGVCWLLLALFLPEYVWLGVIPLVLVLLFRIRTLCKNLRKFAYCVILIAAFGGILAGLCSLPLWEKQRESQRTFWFAMAGRIAWPKLWEDRGYWSEELRILVENLVWEASDAPDNMERLLQPAIEGAVGEEKAKEYYREMVEAAWRLHRDWLIRLMAEDMLTYAAPSAILQRQLTGGGYVSGSGRNYEIMFMNSPRLTKYYVSYSSWWFFVALGAVALLTAVGFLAGEWRFSLKKMVFPTMVLLWMGVVVCFYVMQGAGIADYKYTIAASSLWSFLALNAIGRGLYVMEPERGKDAPIS